LEPSSADKKPTIIYKVVFKNAIGKVLYKSEIRANGSRHRRIPEKVFKNQLKIAVAFQDEETKAWSLEYCLINFNRHDDLEEFEKSLTEAIDALKPAKQ